MPPLSERQPLTRQGGKVTSVKKAPSEGTNLLRLPAAEEIRRRATTRCQRMMNFVSLAEKSATSASTIATEDVGTSVTKLAPSKGIVLSMTAEKNGITRCQISVMAAMVVTTVRKLGARQRRGFELERRKRIASKDLRRLTPRTTATTW